MDLVSALEEEVVSTRAGRRREGGDVRRAGRAGGRRGGGPGT